MHRRRQRLLFLFVYSKAAAYECWDEAPKTKKKGQLTDRRTIVVFIAIICYDLNDEAHHLTDFISLCLCSEYAQGKSGRSSSQPPPPRRRRSWRWRWWWPLFVVASTRQSPPPVSQPGPHRLRFARTRRRMLPPGQSIIHQIVVNCSCPPPFVFFSFLFFSFLINESRSADLMTSRDRKNNSRHQLVLPPPLCLSQFSL